MPREQARARRNAKPGSTVGKRCEATDRHAPASWTSARYKAKAPPRSQISARLTATPRSMGDSDFLCMRMGPNVRHERRPKAGEACLEDVRSMEGLGATLAEDANDMLSALSGGEARYFMECVSTEAVPAYEL